MLIGCADGQNDEAQSQETSLEESNTTESSGNTSDTATDSSEQTPDTEKDDSPQIRPGKDENVDWKEFNPM